MKTKVIFRKFRDDGDIIALFPELPGNLTYTTCLSYMHIGQHGSASVDLNGYHYPLATPEEYHDLKVELESLGYDLKIAKKITRKDIKQRIAYLKG